MTAMTWEDWVWTIQGIGWTSCWTTVHHGREFPMHVWEMNPPIIDSDVYRYWEGYDPEQRPTRIPGQLSADRIRDHIRGMEVYRDYGPYKGPCPYSGPHWDHHPRSCPIVRSTYGMTVAQHFRLSPRDRRSRHLARCLGAWEAEKRYQDEINCYDDEDVNDPNTRAFIVPPPPSLTH